MPVDELVVAVYSTRARAEAAIRQLQREGVDPRSLSIVDAGGGARGFWVGIANLWPQGPGGARGVRLLVRGTREDAMHARELLHDAPPEPCDRPETARRG